MKKLLFALTLLTLSLSAFAQKKQLTEDQRDEAMYNLFARTTLVDGKFAITREPITWYDYWAATGEKAHSPNTSVTHAAIVTDSQKEKMAKCVNEYLHDNAVKVATNQEIRTAHERIGLHRELGQNSLAGSGFFLSMSAERYKYYKNYVSKHRSLKPTKVNNSSNNPSARNNSSNNSSGRNNRSNNPSTSRNNTSRNNNQNRSASQKQKDEEFNKILKQVEEEQKQQMNADKSIDIMIDLFKRLKLVNNKFAITKTPITYKEYWGATYEKAHKSDADLNKTAIVSKSQQSKMLKGLNEFFMGNYYSIATNEQIKQAGFTPGKGFYVVMSAKAYKEFKSQQDAAN